MKSINDIWRGEGGGVREGGDGLVMLSAIFMLGQMRRGWIVLFLCPFAQHVRCVTEPVVAVVYGLASGVRILLSRAASHLTDCFFHWKYVCSHIHHSERSDSVTRALDVSGWLLPVNAFIVRGYKYVPLVELCTLCYVLCVYMQAR